MSHVQKLLDSVKEFEIYMQNCALVPFLAQAVQWWIS